MTNQLKKHSNRIISIIAGILIPTTLFISIPVLFKSEIKLIKNKPPIIVDMITLQRPFEVKPKNQKTEPTIALPKKSTPRKTRESILKKNSIQKVSFSKIKTAEKNFEKNSPKNNAKPKKEVLLEKKHPSTEHQKAKHKFPTPVPIFKITASPQFLHREKLIYPEKMRSSGMSGIVNLAVLIDKEGVVHRVTILKSAGKLFDQAAKKALLASTFIPAKMEGKAVPVEMKMPVKFRLL